ncbi:hypothetical protein NQ317_004628 [Molorchus minor]|uniref:CRAL-TRIO domain-containing protein n=1 Tax=Molorchus minor TaxID=1323400 RepID=A0ABQ9JIR4_9CUCU|nr:hypothetical protein NQ317_004628 [Molorchus minor]
MTRLSKLLQCTESEKQAIFKNYGIAEQDFEGYIDILQEWLAKTNLPKNDDTRSKLSICLLNCKMSLEDTKKCISGYYRIRTIYSNFFDKMMPYTEDYNKVKRFAISIFRIRDPKGEMNDGLLYQLIGVMVTEMRIKSSDYFLSNILIIDLQEFELKHLIKYTPGVIQKLVHLMLAIKLRLKNIHFVNTSEIIDRVMVLVKTMLPEKFVDRVATHRTPESLYEYIPKEYLPSDYDGSQPSIADLHEQWCEALEEREEDFKKLLDAKCYDDMDKLIENEVFGIGSEGSFKKLAID